MIGTSMENYKLIATCLIDRVAEVFYSQFRLNRNLREFRLLQKKVKNQLNMIVLF